MSFSTNTVSGTVCALPPGSRSCRLDEQLTIAHQARQVIALSGHTGDVLVSLGTGRPVRLREFLAIWAAEQGCDFVHLDSRHGGNQILPPGWVPDGQPLIFQPAPMHALLHSVTRTIVHHSRPVAVYADWSCEELDADDGDLRRTIVETATEPTLGSGGHQLILNFRSTTRLMRQVTSQPGFAVINIGLPDAPERQFVLRASDQNSPIPLGDGLTVDGVATTLGGMTNDALLRVGHRARARGPLTRADLIELKVAEIERVAQGRVIVNREPDPERLAAMAGLRLYLLSRQRAGMPVGPLLLAGGPGVGKTYAALWLAYRMTLPLVTLGSIKGGIVGDSEANWAQAREILVANAPCVVFIDEVDQAGLGKRSSGTLDAGVSEYLRAEYLKFTNDARKLGITVVFATNNPAGIDGAGLDRVEVIPCLEPSTDEAVEIMMIAAARERFELDSQAARAVLAARQAVMTGRELVRLLDTAAVYAADAGHPTQIGGTDIAAAAADSLGVASLANEYMALSAILLCKNRALLPWVASERLGEPVELPHYVRPLLDPSGQLDMAAVQRRVIQLRDAGHGFNS